MLQLFRPRLNYLTWRSPRHPKKKFIINSKYVARPFAMIGARSSRYCFACCSLLIAFEVHTYTYCRCSVPHEYTASFIFWISDKCNIRRDATLLLPMFGLLSVQLTSTGELILVQAASSPSEVSGNVTIGETVSPRSSFFCRLPLSVVCASWDGQAMVTPISSVCPRLLTSSCIFFLFW